MGERVTAEEVLALAVCLEITGPKGDASDVDDEDRATAAVCLAALRAAVGGGWVCIEPDTGRLFTAGGGDHLDLDTGEWSGVTLRPAAPGGADYAG